MATRLARFSGYNASSSSRVAGSMWPRTLSGFNAFLSGGYSPEPASLKSARCHIDCDVLVPSVSLGLGSSPSTQSSHSTPTHSRSSAHSYFPSQSCLPAPHNPPPTGLVALDHPPPLPLTPGAVVDLRQAVQYLKAHSFARDPRLRKLPRLHGATHSMHAASETYHVVLQLPTNPPRLVVVSDLELLKLLRKGAERNNHGLDHHSNGGGHHHGARSDRAIPLAPPSEHRQPVRWTV